MKLKFMSVIVMVIILIACAFQVSGEESSSNEILTPDYDKVLSARLENMLDHNNVYNDDFDDITIMVDNSIISLLDKGDEEGYIERNIVEGFVYNMYGITLSEYVPNPNFEQKQNKIFIIPRGFESFNHEITSIENDGIYTVVTSTINIETHDCFAETLTCRSMFIENGSSAFGYNLVSSVYF